MNPNHLFQPIRPIQTIDPLHQIRPIHVIHPIQTIDLLHPIHPISIFNPPPHSGPGCGQINFYDSPKKIIFVHFCSFEGGTLLSHFWVKIRALARPNLKR